MRNILYILTVLLALGCRSQAQVRLPNYTAISEILAGDLMWVEKHNGGTNFLTRKMTFTTLLAGLGKNLLATNINTGSIAVTNNATVGGNLGVTGDFTVGGTFTFPTGDHNFLHLSAGSGNITNDLLVGDDLDVPYGTGSFLDLNATTASFNAITEVATANITTATIHTLMGNYALYTEGIYADSAIVTNTITSAFAIAGTNLTDRIVVTNQVNLAGAQGKLVFGSASGATVPEMYKQDGFIHFSNGTSGGPVPLALGGGGDATLVTFRIGTGTPEGAVVADRGSIFLRTDGGASTTLYIKTSGDASNTGWTAK